MRNKIVQIIDDLGIDKSAPLNFETELFGGVRISNISSFTTANCIEGEAVYSSTKSAVQTYSKSLVKEISKFQLRINFIAPGPNKTNLLSGVPGDWISLIDVSQFIYQQHTTSDVAKSVVSNDIS
jgi:short-subunit dehydrogenase